MARSRNIKPGFFTNEVLGELDPLARILFAGLWCHADREGRLEDRLKRLKPQILPFDECDIEHLAQCLHDANLVLRYVVDGKRYIQILKFSEHQNPHIKEAPSTIPAPCSNKSSIGVATLIPSSLIPDSPIPSKPNTRARAAKKLNGAARFELPADIDPGLWAEFIEMRQKIRKPPTDRAKWLIIGKLANIEAEHGHPPRKVLQQSIRNSWQDVFPLRDEGRK